MVNVNIQPVQVSANSMVQMGYQFGIGKIENPSKPTNN